MAVPHRITLREAIQIMSRGLDAKAYLADLADNGIPLPQLPRAIVLAMHPDVFPRRCREMAGPFGRVVATRRAPSVVTVGPLGPGPAVAAVTIELLAELGVTSIVAVGIASAVQRDDVALVPGSFVVVDEAVTSDAVASAYAPSTNASRSLTASVVEATQAQRGRTYSTSIPFRLDVEDVLASGADVVEMEGAALFAAAASRGVEVSLAVAISDVTSVDGWKPGDRSIVGASTTALADTCREVVGGML